MQILSDRKIKEVFTKIPQIQTPRLLLRKIVSSDSEDMFEYSRSERVTEYLTWPPHKALSETQRYIKLLDKKYSKGAFWDFGIEYLENGKFLGTCGFTSFSTDTNSAEIGYVLNQGYWGMGLAPEAARAVMKFGFTVFDLDKICARFIAGNHSSQRVMEKLGMKYVTTYKNSFFIKNQYRTVLEYEIRKREFFELCSGSNQ